MSLSLWWRQRSTAQRLDMSTRWGLVALSASEPLLVGLLVGSQEVRPLGAAFIMVVSLVHTAACVALLRAGLEHVLGGRRPSRRLIAVAAGGTAAAMVAAVAAFPAFNRSLDGPFELGHPVGLAAAMLFGGALTAAVAPLVSARWLVAAVVVPAAAFGAVQQLTDRAGDDSWALIYGLQVGVVVLTYRSSVWSLRLIWELDRARDAQARLAVAEERLRFARDMHDVLGRNLAVIAVTSDLAAQLAPRTSDAAAERMLEVRQVAHDSMRELRAVVGGYRSADLDAELAGARALLASAGVRARVIGDGKVLPPEAQEALAWAVREGVTNMIRHSDASTATVELTVPPTSTEQTAVLTITNDGVRDAAPLRPGHGLTGLRERLAGVGGRLETTTLPTGRFVLEATVPIAPTGAVPAAAADPVGRLPA
jgi:two-component system sensor histidine kinase DesK